MTLMDIAANVGTVRCENCGASNAVADNQPLLRCEYCKSILLVERTVRTGSELRTNLTICSRPIQSVFDAPANYLHDGHAYGGRLYVTRSELVFVPHAFNFTTGYRLVFPFTDLRDMQKINHLFVVRKLLLVQRDGHHAEFVVWHRDAVIDAVRKHL